MIEVNKIIEQSYNRLPEEWKSHPWDLTNHGRKVLNSELELDAYLAAYGEMHFIKCRAALQNFPCTSRDDEIQKHNYEIFDWGCGQGIATLTLLEFLRERGLLGRLKKITLIEPSETSLKRATQWISQSVGPSVTVIAVNKYIPTNLEETIDEVSCSNYVSINMFSNILDIKSVNLLWLANKTASLANINYMMCIGPKYSDKRIIDFCGYFNSPSYFSDIDSEMYAYTQRTHYPYSCVTRCFVHMRDESINNAYIEIAPDIAISDDYDYSLECLRSIVDDKALFFYNKIRSECSEAFDVFIKPNIGVDTPDLLLANISRGFVIVNICDDVSKLESAYNRIENIKSYIFNTHLKSIKVDSIINKSVYGCVKVGLFFPNSSRADVKNELKRLNDIKNEQFKNSVQKNYFAYLITLFVDDDYRKILNHISVNGFRFDYYDELIKLIVGNWHTYSDGDTNFILTERQRNLVRSNNMRLRVKGVAGCGKTQVVANRAVERQISTGRKVLILTFNISLIQYVRMRINQVPADFSTNMFEITNYHQFFLSMANKYSDKKISLSDFDDALFFAPYKDRIRRYDSIIIDEVQDFKTAWLSSIIYYFLAPNGSISVFGDGEQNIYDRAMAEEKMPSIPTFSGQWNKINERISMRIINPAIAQLAFHFAQKYVDNTIQALNVQNELIFEQYFIKYWNVGRNKTANTLSQNIIWIKEEYKLDFKDVVVLSESINILRDIEKALLHVQIHCMTNFETDEQYRKLKQSQTSTSLFQKDLQEIRRAAKTHFTTDTDKIKLSTIHSFKGWESKTVILIMQPEMQKDEAYEGYYIQERENNPSLIYTALTRAKCNLFILNLGNPKYDLFFKKNII